MSRLFGRLIRRANGCASLSKLNSIGAEKLSEVFASYIDRAAVTVTLDGKTGDYAWRVYTVGVTDPDYVLSEWHRFSIRAPQ